MTEDSISIRLATVADVDVLTELHYASFIPEEHVPVMLGKHYVRATYVWLTTGKSSYVLVAEELGKIVGLIAVCDGPFTRPMFMACLPAFMRSLVTHPTLIFKKKLWSRLFRRPDVSANNKKIVDFPGFAQMTIGVVDKDCRGKGVFPALVAATKTYSKARGSRAIRAGIYKTNTPSRRVFIKGEWLETPELETSDTVFYVAYLDSRFMDELGIQRVEQIS
jgi:hypothetical protein